LEMRDGEGREIGNERKHSKPCFPKARCNQDLLSPHLPPAAHKSYKRSVDTERANAARSGE
jgi:hypothetical protein